LLTSQKRTQNDKASGRISQEIPGGQGKTPSKSPRKGTFGQWFRNTEIKEDTPRARSLLSRPKSKVGYVIGKSAVDDVYSAFLSGKLSNSKAVTIAPFFMCKKIHFCFKNEFLGAYTRARAFLTGDIHLLFHC
jgi:hypothetical protein